jgi:hypothetical protein
MEVFDVAHALVELCFGERGGTLRSVGDENEVGEGLPGHGHLELEVSVHVGSDARDELTGDIVLVEFCVGCPNLGQCAGCGKDFKLTFVI